MSYESTETMTVYSGVLGSWEVLVRRERFAEEQLQGKYDRIAPRWQRLIHRLGYPSAYRRLFEQVAPDLRKSAGTGDLRVLDCGVGSGAMAIAFSQVWSQRIDVTGVDISEAMLAQASEACQQEGLCAALTRADVSDLPFPDGAFDLVLAGHVLEHCASPERAIGEIFRVLKDRGCAIVCVTRQSALGKYVQLKWRTHLASRGNISARFRRAGFRNTNFYEDLGWCFERSSLALLAVKDAGQAENKP